MAYGNDARCCWTTGTDDPRLASDPYKPAVERPRPAIVATLLRPLVQRFFRPDDERRMSSDPN